MVDNCPLCNGEMESLYHTEKHKETGFHYWCTACKHGWYIADLMGMCFKDPVKVRELIRRQDENNSSARRG